MVSIILPNAAMPIPGLYCVWDDKELAVTLYTISFAGYQRHIPKGGSFETLKRAANKALITPTMHPRKVGVSPILVSHPLDLDRNH